MLAISPFFSKGDSVFDFLFASRGDFAFQIGVHSKGKEFTLLEAIFFL